MLRKLLTCSVLVTTCAAAQAAPKYLLTNLGNLGSYGFGMAINDSNQVTGYSVKPGTPSQMRAFFVGQNHGKPTAMVELPTLGGSGFAFAYAINAAGTIVGDSFNASGQKLPFMYDNGTMSAIPAQAPAFAYDINDSGAVVGVQAVGSGQAYLYTGGAAVTNLQATWDPAGTSITRSEARGINNAGAIVGVYTPAGGAASAYLYSGTVFTNLGEGQALWTYPCANAVSDSGVVVGTFKNGSNRDHAFVYNANTGEYWLDYFNGGANILGGVNSQANAVNDEGEVVGQFTPVANEPSHAFHLINGKMRDLNEFVIDKNGDPLTGWTITNATGINSDGNIVAWATDGNAQYAVLLTAMPLPGSAIMGMVLLAGIGGLSIYRRMRHAD